MYIKWGKSETPRVLKISAEMINQLIDYSISLEHQSNICLFFLVPIIYVHMQFSSVFMYLFALVVRRFYLLLHGIFGWFCDCLMIMLI